MTEVLVAQRWKSNSELIRAVFDMHVFPRIELPRVVDLTYGKGTWWKLLPTDRFFAWSQNRRQYDFTCTPHADAVWDVVLFDPDYVAPGGRETSTIKDFNERYGLDGVYESPASLQAHINAGLTECARIVRPQGLILHKTTDYVSSGSLQTGVYWCLKHGIENLGLVVEDLWVHVSDPRMQPKDRKCSQCGGSGLGSADCPRCDGTGRVVPRQQHARSNTSTLIIWRKPGRRKKT